MGAASKMRCMILVFATLCIMMISFGPAVLTACRRRLPGTKTKVIIVHGGPYNDDQYQEAKTQITHNVKDFVEPFWLDFRYKTSDGFNEENKPVSFNPEEELSTMQIALDTLIKKHDLETSQCVLYMHSHAAHLGYLDMCRTTDSEGIVDRPWKKIILKGGPFEHLYTESTLLDKLDNNKIWGENDTDALKDSCEHDDFLEELDDVDSKTGKTNKEQLKTVSASINKIIAETEDHTGRRITPRYRSDLLAAVKEALTPVVPGGSLADWCRPVPFETLGHVKRLADAMRKLEYKPLGEFRVQTRTTLEKEWQDALCSRVPYGRICRDTQLLIVYGKHDSNFMCNVTADFLATGKCEKYQPNAIETHWATIQERLQKTFSAHKNTEVMLIPGGHKILRPESKVDCSAALSLRQEGFEEMMKLMRE